MQYYPSEDRYRDKMKYRRCGKSGILLPEISLGLWHNFGGVDPYEGSKAKILYAFDNGITHFDLANNYGPPYGSAEETFGRIIKNELYPYRDELLISTKAGHDMWKGPYGEWGSRKHLFASINQSLQRMNLEYVDIFYSHRYDPDTPLEETMQALSDIVKAGKALYVGISKYPYDVAEKAYKILKENKTPCLILQGRFNILEESPLNNGVLSGCEKNGVGFIAFSPLAQGLLSDRYLNGIPNDSRIARGGYLKKETLTEKQISIIKSLNQLAIDRGESLAQMAINWLLGHHSVTSVLIGASSVEQLKINLATLNRPPLSDQEKQLIQNILTSI
ncbi:MAG: aldo/keto reductase [Muribaculaceae bacterium]|nr:aldo/keto reductase [Muribaculaceae bacterium]